MIGLFACAHHKSRPLGSQLANTYEPERCLALVNKDLGVRLRKACDWKSRSLLRHPLVAGLSSFLEAFGVVALVATTKEDK